MSKPKYSPKYVQPERNDKGRLVAKGTLKHGLKIGDEVHREFEMQEPNTGDLFAAEQETTVQNVMTFNGALMARQLVRIGSFAGPFTLGMIGTLRTVDFNLLREAQTELDVLGEAE
jgi:Mu-like prophage FluMu protein gp41